MAQQANPQEMNRFVKSVDEFFANYEKLTTPAMRNQVSLSGQPELIADYQAAVSRGATLSQTIQGTVGAWTVAKSAWATVTGATSTMIGDAIDEIRSWFGYEPAGGVGFYDPSPISGGTLGQWRSAISPLGQWRGSGTPNPGTLGTYDPSPISGGRLGALGAIALPAAAWVATILGAVYLMNQAMGKLFIWVDANSIQKADPTISREKALDVAARTAARGGLFGDAGKILPLLAAIALGAYLLLGQKK